MDAVKTVKVGACLPPTQFRKNQVAVACKKGGVVFGVQAPPSWHHPIRRLQKNNTLGRKPGLNTLLNALTNWTPTGDNISGSDC